MGALTKAEMAERLYEELGLNKREAKELVELFFEEIRQALSGVLCRCFVHTRMLRAIERYQRELRA